MGRGDDWWVACGKERREGEREAGQLGCAWEKGRKGRERDGPAQGGEREGDYRYEMQIQMLLNFEFEI
jgi:hypothetical protein